MRTWVLALGLIVGLCGSGMAQSSTSITVLKGFQETCSDQVLSRADQTGRDSRIGCAMFVIGVAEAINVQQQVEAVSAGKRPDICFPEQFSAGSGLTLVNESLPALLKAQPIPDTQSMALLIWIVFQTRLACSGT